MPFPIFALIEVGAHDADLDTDQILSRLGRLISESTLANESLGRVWFKPVASLTVTPTGNRYVTSYSGGDN